MAMAMHPFPRSIRAQLIILVLVAILPALGIILSTGMDRKEDEIQQAYDRSLFAARILAVQQEQITANTRHLLQTLSRSPAVQSGDAKACARIFRDIVEKNPLYQLVSIADAEGMIYAFSQPGAPFSVADRKYYREALETRDFAAGEYALSRLAKTPTLHFAYPVTDRDGRVKSLLIATLNLNLYDRFIKDLSSLEGYVMVVTDHKGIRLYRYPDADSDITGVGVIVSEESLKNIAGPSEEGIYEGTGSDGTRRIYAFKRLRLSNESPPYLSILVGAGKDAVLKEANSIMDRSLIYFALATVFALLAAWYLGNFTIVNRLKAIMAAAGRLREGDLQSRTGLPYAADTIGQLARSFDEMSQAIEDQHRERQQAEEERKVLQHRLSQLIDFLPDPTLAIDREKRVIVWNRAMEEMTGIPAGEMLGRGDYAYSVPFYGMPRPQLMDLFWVPGHEIAGQYPSLQREDNNLVSEVFCPALYGGRGAHVWVKATALFDAGGNLAGAIEVIRDITGRKRAEEALRESEERLRVLFDSIDDFVFIKDLNRRYVLINDFFTKRFRIDRSEILGKTDAELTLFENKTITLSTVRDTDSRVLAGESVQYEMTHMIRETPITFNILKTPIRDDQGMVTGICGVSRDISERRRAEERRRMLEERLQRSEKMESLGMLAGGVAHDLNNVLGILVGYSELLGVEIDRKSPLRPHIEYIRLGGERAAAIVQDLLTMARRGVLTREVVNLNDTIAEYRKTPEFDKLCSFHPRVEIETRLEAELLNIRGSSIHLGKTLINLVSNAAEAMPAGGALTITTSNRYLDKPVAGYDDVREGDYVVLSVSDTGDGISAADLKRIFEPFYTKKVMGRSGTGLGLAVVWGTVKDHNGYINVQSEPGRGTTFSLFFPVTREETTRERKSIPESEYLGEGESVLVVDDVTGQRELAARMLTKLNYRVATVASGEEAVEYLKTKKVDLVVLDMIMDNGIDGLETYRRIMEIHPGQKAIIVSGFSETDRVRRAQELGAGAYVKKPYMQEKLGLTVRNELRKA